MMQHGAREQRSDNKTHQERRSRAQLNGAVYQPPASFENTQLINDSGFMGWLRRVQAPLEPAGTIDDASKASAQYIQQSADSGQKEYGSDRELDDMCDLVIWIHGLISEGAD